MIPQTLLLLSIIIIIPGAKAATYEPTDHFLFNCGATTNQTDGSGRNWTPENRKILPSNSNTASSISDASHQESGVSQVPYMKARIFQTGFTYNFPVTPGWKFLRLHFYPTRYNSGFDAVNSFFSVTVNGFTLLRNFSADLTARASVPKNPTVVKEYIIPVNQTSTLSLTFTPSSPNSLAFVNGIEIVSTPDRYYSKGGFDDAIINVGSSVVFEIDNSTAFESVYRLNVGGQEIGEVGDSGMFRRWLSDDDFMLSENSGIKVQAEGVKINYTAQTPAYVAPEELYRTSRGMGNVENPKLNLGFNLTWLFTVDAGFYYLVRLHFCETFVKDVKAPSDRVFSIFLGNQTAKHETDVFQLSGGSLIPMYLDFHVFVSPGSTQRPDLQLDLHPFSETNPDFYDVILNGVEILKLNNSDGSLAGYNPVPQTSPTPNSNSVTRAARNGKGKSNVLVIILAVVGTAIVLAMFVGVLVMLLIKKRNKKAKMKDFSVHTKSKHTDSWTPLHTGSTNNTTNRSASSLPSDRCHRFSLFEIKSATDDFDEKLIVGVGGFGKVYKGRIDGGATLVAVKRLDLTSNQGIKEFETELEMLSMLRHIHLVSLIGYCDEDNEMILVYEYMPRGTLKGHLYKRDKGNDRPLSWKERLEICIGAARGIQYLHTGVKHTIIHRDIKTTNILLDENYVAKVADFGLSKVGPINAMETHVSTVVKGTVGYLDPEYYSRGALTDKSDVYSFGVVLFEVLCCRPVRIQDIEREKADLIPWVKLNYKRGTVDQVVDSDLADDITSISLEKYCEIAVRCVAKHGVERPSMNDVVWALEFALQLHESAKKKNNGVDEGLTLPRGEVGTRSEGESDDLFCRTTGHVSNSTMDDDSSALIGNEKSGSSWEGVFSEIEKPKAR